MQDIVDMLQALAPAVTGGPTGPDLAAADVARGHRALRQRRRRRLAAAAGTAAIGAAAIALAATSGPTAAGRPGETSQAASTGARSPLITLAADVAAESQPAGNATLVERETVAPGKARVAVWDLYTDDGRYFFSPTKAGLPAQVQKDNNLGDGMFGREVAAAAYAVKGNLSTAELKMAWPYATPVPAWLSAQVGKGKVSGPQIDNYIWEDSEDALVAGSGNPQVRAGVLRLVSALPGITVTHGTVGGQPSLTLTAGKAELGTGWTGKGPDPKVKKGPAYLEAITINADTGIPVAVVGGPVGHAAVTVSYVVTRVNLAAIAAGKS